ncbi:o-succinylbenzoate--CoA ligase [Janibacter sp. CX7]|uniref:o-succinylbenzoate--CoA ligase n=1 Tax=Janibacter sp. CX7 TaxID=2963431 RepID=UPI0020CEA74F|nr:o-succinylbenzoate--CoA ligase [Janibacter sp. CX7]UTT66546.1 o-succinylbenzoate--CoA ligase [Janibacter sp. CX7]
MPITPLPLPAGPAVLDALPALERALTGTAPIHPHAPGETPTLPEGELPDDLAVAIATSGSTGTPKLSLLTAANLLASAEATAHRLGGPGQWLLALPPHHIAGLQVLLRSIAAGTTPVVVDASAPPFALVEATAGMHAERRYTSLVPTQLTRLVEDPMGLEALRRFDAVLVGGAATPGALLDRARSLGVRVVTTYGMSETAGGCVYNGQPLQGVAVRTGADGVIELCGAVVAHGYLGLDTGAFRTEGGQRWFRTGDLGTVDGDGRVSVTGRADDVINTGGLKIAPRVVEEAVVAHVPAVTEAVVVGVPDPQWGQAVALAAVTSPGGPPVGPVPDAGVAEIREMLRPHLEPAALPRRVLVVDSLPMRGPGKPDRSAVARLLGG